MKRLALFLSLAVSAVSALTIAAAPIKNDGVLASLIIPDTYIVKYKADADVAKRKQHEKDVHGRARNASKQGIFDTFNIPGLQGYVAEISPSDLDALRNSDLVGTTPSSSPLRPNRTDRLHRTRHPHANHRPPPPETNHRNPTRPSLGPSPHLPPKPPPAQSLRLLLHRRRRHPHLHPRHGYPPYSL